VIGPVAGEEGDGDRLACRRGGVFEDGDRGRRSAPRGFDGQDRGLLEVFETVETGAAYYGDVDGVYVGVRVGRGRRGGERARSDRGESKWGKREKFKQAGAENRPGYVVEMFSETILQK